MIAICYAVSQRPFNTVSNLFYLQEIELLQPGTQVPTPSTVSWDIQNIYQAGSDVVKEYFSVCFKD
jgi:hypothetical protein